MATQYHYKIEEFEVCDACGGSGERTDPDYTGDKSCPVCGGEGGFAYKVMLIDVLRDLGILDRLAALESEVRHSTRA